MFTVLDVETTYQGKWGSDDSDPSPYNPLNKLVSVGYRTSTGENAYLIFHHKEGAKCVNIPANTKQLQDVLNRSDMIVGHNLKFDMSWLHETGFTYEGKLYDTMIFEYLINRGMKESLKLKEVLDKYKLSSKLDILDLYCGGQGLNVDEVPLDKLIEYGIADINITLELYQLQLKKIKSDTFTMLPVMKLMNEFLEVLIEMERNGVKIDYEALDEVEQEFKARHTELERELKTIIQDVMGHTPINLNSPEQISWVLHSIKVNDKEKWTEIFNLGTEERNGVTKKKYAKRYNPREFRQILKENCTTLKRTVAKQCTDCLGVGYIQRYNKDGRPRKNLNVCHKCGKTGILYDTTNTIAGFRIAPISYKHASAGGFSSSKDTLEELLALDISDQAREFIELLREYNAVSTYLTSFVEGIRKNVRDNAILHTSFNQCLTATGRLSSSRPNLQNQPRESTFPIRKVFISRYDGGLILNADFKQLEFRVAAFLSQCETAIADILNNVDVHQQTADWITNAGQEMGRQAAKIRTFRPLYGGTSGTTAEQAYYALFFKKYDGIFEWHNELLQLAIDNKYIKTPSTREYAFPFAERQRNGGVSFHTQIKNYPVQGFATGDILPITMIELYKLMKKHKVKSKIVLTVHDSIVVDVYKGEKDAMIQLFKEAFANTIPALKERFGIDFNVPLDFDLEIGYNLLKKEKVK